MIYSSAKWLTMLCKGVRQSFHLPYWNHYKADKHGRNHVYLHDDITKWNFFLRYCPFVWGIHHWLVNSTHKGQRRRALMFSLICTWTNGWANNRDAFDLKHRHGHYDVTVKWLSALQVLMVLFILVLGNLNEKWQQIPGKKVISFASADGLVYSGPGKSQWRVTTDSRKKRRNQYSNHYAIRISTKTSISFIVSDEFKSLSVLCCYEILKTAK